MSREVGEEAYRWGEALQRAIRRNRRDAHNRYLQLGTVREDGSPAVRTLVFREFCAVSLELRTVTDRRSAKVEEIAARPAGEISWYFTQTREQFRLRGTLRLEGANPTAQHARRNLWNKLSARAREQFFWPEPGRPLDANCEGPDADDASEPPDTFVLLALGVDRVDHLTLRGDPQSRTISWRDANGTWLSEAVNP